MKANGDPRLHVTGTHSLHARAWLWTSLGFEGGGGLFSPGLGLQGTVSGAAAATLQPQRQVFLGSGVHTGKGELICKETGSS